MFFQRRIARKHHAPGLGTLAQVQMLFFGENGVLEERSCALAIRIAWHDQHAFQRTDMADRFPRLREVRPRLATGEMPLQVGVFNVRLAPGIERERDAQNDEPPTLTRIEDAGTIRESAGFVAELTHLSVFRIEDFDRLDGFGHFLAIGSYVLYRCSTDAAGDAAEAFDTCTLGHDSM